MICVGFQINIQDSIVYSRVGFLLKWNHNSKTIDPDLLFLSKRDRPIMMSFSSETNFPQLFASLTLGVILGAALSELRISNRNKRQKEKDLESLRQSSPSFIRKLNQMAPVKVFYVP